MKGTAGPYNESLAHAMHIRNIGACVALQRWLQVLTEFRKTEFRFCFHSQTALMEFHRLCNPLLHGTDKKVSSNYKWPNVPHLFAGMSFGLFSLAI